MRSLGQIILEQEKSKKQKEYEEFFKAKLAEYGAESPADLSTEEKKKFFNEIEKEWDGEVSEAVEKDVAKVEGGVKADNEDQENGEGAGKEIAKEMGDGDATSDDIEDAENKMGEPKKSGDGEEEVTDDQEITAKVTEALADIEKLDEAGDVKLMKRKLDSIVGSTLTKIIDELSKKGFSKEEIEKYMKLVVSDRIEESLKKKVNEEDSVEFTYDQNIKMQGLDTKEEMKGISKVTKFLGVNKLSDMILVADTTQDDMNSSYLTRFTNNHRVKGVSIDSMAYDDVAYIGKVSSEDFPIFDKPGFYNTVVFRSQGDLFAYIKK